MKPVEGVPLIEHIFKEGGVLGNKTLWVFDRALHSVIIISL